MLRSVDALPGITWTRDRVMRAAGFDPVEDLRRARDATLAALDALTPTVVITTEHATIEKGGDPDHPTRLKAASQVYAWNDLTGKAPMITANISGPVQITWRPPTSAKSSSPSNTNGTSPKGLNGSTSSSATGDSGKPSWL